VQQYTLSSFNPLQVANIKSKYYSLKELMNLRIGNAVVQYNGTGVVGVTRRDHSRVSESFSAEVDT